MKYSQYKFKFYLNASHAIYLRGNLGQNHPHTWEIILETLKVRKEFVQFDFIEKSVEKFFNTFQDSDINKIEPFNIINPTLENLTEYFEKSLSEILSNNGWLLTRIEMSETPSRSYIIDRSNRLDDIYKNNINNTNKKNIIDNSAEEKIEQILGPAYKN